MTFYLGRIFAFSTASRHVGGYSEPWRQLHSVGGDDVIDVQYVRYDFTDSAACLTAKYNVRIHKIPWNSRDCTGKLVKQLRDSWHPKSLQKCGNEKTGSHRPVEERGNEVLGAYTPPCS